MQKRIYTITANWFCNFIIAKDTDNNKIVALTIYQPMNYSYCGSIVKGTRLEEVFCEPEYQNEGVLEKILDKIAELSDEKGRDFRNIFVILFPKMPSHIISLN